MLQIIRKLLDEITNYKQVIAFDMQAIKIIFFE